MRQITKRSVYVSINYVRYLVKLGCWNVVDEL
jgi:hypothetical protein